MNPFGKIVVVFRLIEPGPQKPTPKMMVYAPEMDVEQMISHFSSGFWAFFPVAMVTSAQSFTIKGSTLVFVDIFTSVSSDYYCNMDTC